MTPSLHIGQNVDGGANVALPLDILRASHLLITGTTRSGKSYTTRVIAEEACPVIPTIIIDPEDEYPSLREKFPFVLVKKTGGDTVASARTAHDLALKLLELRASAVCALNDLTTECEPKDDDCPCRNHWVRNFVRALVNAPRTMWHPTMVMIDEAHLFCPEKGAEDSVSRKAVIDLATRGAKRGYVVVMATQRPARLQKSAAEMLQNYLIGRTFGPGDRAAVAEALGIRGKVEKQAFFDQIKLLPQGQFYGLGVAISPDPLLVKVKHSQTTHPKSGEHVPAPPPAPEAIRGLLPQLADLPKEVEEREMDAADMRAHIARLQQELARMAETQSVPSAPAGPGEEEIARIVESAKAHMRQALSVRMAQIRVQVNDYVAGIKQSMHSIRKGVEDSLKEADTQFAVAVEAENRLLQNLEVEVVTDLEMEGFHEASKDVRFTQIPQPSTGSVKVTTVPLRDPHHVHDVHHVHNTAPVSGGLSRPQTEILRRLAEFAAIRREPVRLAWLAASIGTTVRARGFEENIRQLRQRGLIESTGDGMARRTDAGRRLSGSVKPLSGTDLRARIYEMLSGPQAQMLTLLVAHSAGIRVDALAAKLSTTERARGFEENLRVLRSNEIVETVAGGVVRPASWLFVEAR
jgi:hypothetical protein